MDYPGIICVSYLKGHDLLLEFDNGELRLCDLSDSFSSGFNSSFNELNKFQDFDFDKFAVWWGPRNTEDTPEIGADSLYRMSIPLIGFNSSAIQSLSMALVDSRSVPFKADMYVRSNEFENEPHVHVIYDGNEYSVSIADGSIIKPSLSEVPVGMAQKFSEWVLKNRKKAVLVWNKVYPNMQADPATGLLI
jgi:hypothetical protein